MQTRESIPIFASAMFVGEPGSIPGPVEMENPGDRAEPSLRNESPAIWHLLDGVDMKTSPEGFCAIRSGIEWS